MSRRRADVRRGGACALAAAFAAALAASAVLAITGPARAHEFRPGLLDVTALGGGRYAIAWVPAPGGERARLVFPERCAREVDSPPRRQVLDCGARGLAGERITVAELAPLRDEVLLRFHVEGGATTTAMLSAGRPSFDVPGVAADDAAGVAAGPRDGAFAGPRDGASMGRGATSAIASYALAGAAHLVTGLDHVLFLIGLLLLVKRARALFFAVTAFTAAHSLSLALQVLGALRLPPAPVEAAIALSVLFVARELLRPPDRRTLAQRRPYVVTFAFGLLHGLGFAGGLAAMEVPRAEVPAALFGFNIGLEAAQIGVVLVALAAGWALGPAFVRLPAWTRRAPAYSLGAAAAFWLFSRTAAFLS